MASNEGPILEEAMDSLREAPQRVRAVEQRMLAAGMPLISQLPEPVHVRERRPGDDPGSLVGNEAQAGSVRRKRSGAPAKDTSAQ